MIKQIERFKKSFIDHSFDVTAPDIIQSLDEDELKKLLPNFDGWIIGDDPVTHDVLKAGKEGIFKAAVKWGIGVDNIDFDACDRFSIPISNTPNIFGSEVADLAMCYLIGLARDAFYIDREVRNNNWVKPSGISLSNKTIGIVGLGDIGTNIAKRAHAHEMNIIGWDPYINNTKSYICKNLWPNKIDECDFLVFACSLTKSTFHLFNDEILAKVKPGVRLVNVSRGQLVNEKTLIKGLSNKQIKSAALDVFEEEPLSINHEILKYPNCILGSHNASNTVDGVIRASEESIALLYNMLSNE